MRPGARDVAPVVRAYDEPTALHGARWLATVHTTTKDRDSPAATATDTGVLWYSSCSAGNRQRVWVNRACWLAGNCQIEANNSSAAAARLRPRAHVATPPGRLANRTRASPVEERGSSAVDGRRRPFRRNRDTLTGVHSGWSPALTRAMILRPWPPPRQAAQTVRHVPPQPSQPSPSLRHLRQEHSVCPVPPHMGHALPCAHTGLTRAAGQRLVVVLLLSWGEAHAPLRFPRALGATAAPRRQRLPRCTAPTGSPQTGRRRPPRWHGGQQTRRAVPAAVVGAASRASGAARARGCSCVAGSLRHPRQDAASSKLSGGHA